MICLEKDEEEPSVFKELLGWIDQIESLTKTIRERISHAQKEDDDDV